MPEAESLFTETSQYLKPEDVTQLRNAYAFGQGAHSGQFRKSGEPYISHPLAVAGILSKLHLDVPTLTAALLHDVVEDTDISKAEISERFGEPVAELVDGGVVESVGDRAFEGVRRRGHFRGAVLGRNETGELTLEEVLDGLVEPRVPDVDGLRDREAAMDGGHQVLDRS